MEQLEAPKFFIDKDGVWYADGVLISRKEILLFFASHLKKDEESRYSIDYRHQSCGVRAEDVPFFITSLREEDGKLLILLYDGREFPMPSGNLIIKNKIPYVSLFWERDTKLSRAAFNLLSNYLIERDGHYLIRYGDDEWPVEEME